MVKKYRTEILENISETSSGGTPSRENADFYKGDIPWITTGELKDGYIFDSKEHITKEALKNSAAKIFPSGTVLMAMYGATIGRLGILKVDAATNQACCAFFPNEQKLKAKYLFYWLFYHRSQLIDMGTGAGQPNISQNIIKKLEIDLPTIQEQDEIVNALSDIDNLISTQEALIAKKQAIKQGAMQELLTGKRRLAGFVDNWCRHKLENIVDFCTSSVRLKDIDVKEYIGTDNMLSNLGGVKDNELCLKYSTVREYKKKDILISNIRPYLQKAWFANRHGGCSNDVLVFRSKDERKYMPLFLYFLLTDGRFFDYATETATGSKMPRGDKEMIKVYELYLPDKIEEQQAIADTLDDMSADIANQQAKLEKLRRIKSGMMDKLLTGKISLTD